MSSNPSHLHKKINDLLFALNGHGDVYGDGGGPGLAAGVLGNVLGRVVRVAGE